MVKNIGFFKRQAKLLLRDVHSLPAAPSYFKNLDYIIEEYGIDVFYFSLIKAQHVIAQMSGYRCWADLKNSLERSD